MLDLQSKLPDLDLISPACICRYMVQQSATRKETDIGMSVFLVSKDLSLNYLA